MHRDWLRPGATERTGGTEQTAGTEPGRYEGDGLSVDLHERLEVVRRRAILHDALAAGARLLYLLLPLCLALLWLDWCFDFSRGLRCVELLLVIWLLYRWVRGCAWPAMHAPRSGYHSALTVEGKFPVLGGRLVSAVQFDAGGGHGSADLMRAVTEQVRERVGGLPIEEAVDFKAQQRPVAAAVIALLVTVSVVFAAPTQTRVWLARMVAPWTDNPWPRRTLVQPDQRAFMVKRAGNLVITGKVLGRIPAKGRVQFGAVGAWRSSLEAGFDIAADGRFEASLSPMMESGTVEVTAGDGVSGAMAVQVIVPPDLAGIEATYQYPAFTGWKAEKVLAGDIRALVGTRVDLAIRTDKAVNKVQLVVRAEDGQTQEIAGTIGETDRMQAAASLAVEKRASYRVLLIDEHGFAADTPPTFVIEPQENEAPTVRIDRPRPEHPVTPATLLRIIYEAKDDFGIKSMVIRFKRGGETEREQVVALPGHGKVVAGTFSWDLTPLNLQAGDIIQYYATVEDEGTHLVADKPSRTEQRTLKVMTPDELREIIAGRLRDLFVDLGNAQRQLSSGIEAVSSVMVALPATATQESGDGNELSRVNTEESRQHRLSQQVLQISRAIRAASEELRDSFLAEKDEVADLERAATTLDGAAAAKMAEAARLLKAASENMAGQPRSKTQ